MRSVSALPHPLTHVAIIMDGNSRWAKVRGLQSLAGHQVGAERLEEVMDNCRHYGIRYLTVFAFSSENWNRPAKEVGGLMSLLASALKRNRKKMVAEGVRLQVIGRRDRLSQRLVDLITQVEEETKNGAYQLSLAVDYGGRWDLVEAARNLALQVQKGILKPEEIDESRLSHALSLKGIPDPDLLIRTGYESRISNFLLWQLSYTELYFADCFWPDFDKNWFAKAIQFYSERDRRFGHSSNRTDDSLGREIQSA